MLTQSITLRATEIIKICSSHKYKIALAESCTGALLAAHFCAVSGASDSFAGSLVAYNKTSIINIFGINKNIINTYGAVSEEVASLMAEKTLQKFGAQWALSAAGCSKPQGILCVALCGPHGTLSKKYLLENLSRRDFRERACEIALKLFLEILKKS